MSRTFWLVLLSLGLQSRISAQFSQNFNTPSTIFASGWAQQNLSSPIGTTTWLPGDPNIFPAQSGADSTYIRANFNSGAGTASISNWLFTPTTTLSNGSVISFWTRTVTGATFPDRLELRMSTSGTGVNVGTTATSVGTYTTLLATVNPTLTTTGYPSVWTQYSVTISGLAGPISGRFAFRYFVTNGGPSGANSDYIGIDNVNYYTPITADAAMTIKDTLEYTLIPQRQQDGSPFNGSILNNGTNALTNVYMQVRVRNAIGGAVVYTANSAVVPSLAAAATANLTATGTTALVPGDYSVEYIAKHSTADGAPLSDTLRNTFSITAEEYARDNGIVTAGVGIGVGNGYIGQEFRLFQPDIIDSIGIWYNGGYTGRRYGLAIWNMTAGGVPNAIVAVTDTLLYPDNLARYYVLPVRNGGVGLAAGEYMVSAIEFDSTLQVGQTASIFTPGDMWVNWTTNPNGTWSNIETFGGSFARASVIRPDLAFNSFSLGTFTTTPAPCGTNGGSASVNILGGSATGATYVWSNGQTTATAVNLAAGTYSVTVTLYGVKTLTGSVTVPGSGTGPTINSMNAGTINCNGGTATITPSVSGGSPGYSYLWSTGATSPTLTAPAGTYIVTVTDLSTCQTVSQPVTLVQPAVLIASISSNAAPCSASNATLTANVAGGTAGYTYLWSNAATGSSITVGAGTYTVTVTDTRGCTAVSAPSIVSNATPPTVSVSAGVIACNGGTATLTSTVTGGTAGFSYAWSGGGSGSSISAVAGTYTVTVTDANGCTASSTPVVLSQPAVLSGTVNATTILCNGGTATLSSTVTGGTAGYSYAWSNGGSASTTTVVAGTYTLTITDTRGCTATPSPIVVSQPAVILPVISGGSILCSGGTATLNSNVTGGNGGYLYNWSNGGSASTTVVGAGTYTLSVTDANGCTGTSAPTTITSPAALTANATAGTIACTGGTTSVNANANGGTGSLLYSWSNGGNTSTITAGSGSYTVTVTDANGCTTTSGPLSVTQPAQLVVNVPAANILCNGGTATLVSTVTGGTAGYTYSWSNGGNTSSITVGAGTYNVIATDAAGCTATSNQVTLTEPTAIAVTVNNTPASSPTANDGTATALVSGGTPGYTYLWSSGSTSPTATGLAPGTYSVTVTDANGCTFVGVSSVLTGLEAPSTLTSFTVSPNPNNGNFQVKVISPSAEDMRFRVFDAAGKLVLTRSALQQTEWMERVQLDGADGIYLIEVEAGAFHQSARLVVNH